MTATHTSSRSQPLARPRRALWCAALGASLLVLIGCASRMAPPERTSHPYQGPPIRLDDSGESLSVVVSSPSPGWQVHLDRIEEGFQTRNVYLTIIRPGPDFQYPQTTVEQRVMTSVSKDLTAHVLGRCVAFGPLDRAKGPYAAVLSRTGTPEKSTD